MSTAHAWEPKIEEKEKEREREREGERGRKKSKGNEEGVGGREETEDAFRESKRAYIRGTEGRQRGIHE